MTITAERTRIVQGPAGKIALSTYGPPTGTPVLMAHSILTSRRMWQQQAHLLAEEGFLVVCPDTRGHGASEAGQPPYRMDDLGADVLAVLDGLGLARAHFVGLSLGAMTGFGLGIRHAGRLLSLCLVAGRADAPREVVAPWDERIRLARSAGCEALRPACLGRWFSPAFLQHHADAAGRLGELIGQTSAAGLEGCARALQQLDYLPMVPRIRTPTTLVVGTNDQAGLPAAVRQIHRSIPGSMLEEIAGSGHFPNIDQPALFNAALLAHFERVAPAG
jgi:3-oxoadipate enol-lactonase